MFDFSGSLSTYPHRYATPEEADAAALASDWEAVGQDFYSAMAVYGKPRAHEQEKKS